jgi:quercetin dioxygenase-like cupin family protein
MPFVNFNTIPHLRLMNGIHGALYHSDQLTFGHLVLEEGAVLPQHNHVHEQWTHMIEGQLEFTLDGETQVLTSGHSVFIPSNVPHSARALSTCKVIDAFLPVREDFKALEPWQSAKDSK